jgi:hypothetical protein
MNPQPELPARRSKATRRLLLVTALGIVSTLFAQFGGFRGGYGGGQIFVDPSTQTAREIGTRSVGTPEWSYPIGFEHDVFTFARLRYDTPGRNQPIGRGRGGWTTDLPDADLNLSYRLQQMTSMKVDPNGRIVRATDPELANFPFLFAAAPGSLALTNDEITALRAYLQNGGFMLMTDSWGPTDENNVTRLFNEILPGRRFVELPIEHPLYQTVFRITEKAQVPNIRIGMKIPGTRISHRVIFDDKGRIMAMVLHNSDDSDGWEREGEDHEYFEKYSEKIAYPLAINILVYQMTH